MLSDSPHVLAIDVGSSAVRAALYDDRAMPVPNRSVAIPHGQVVGTDGTSIEDATELAELVEAAVDQVLQQSGEVSESIVGVGLASMASTILGIDSDGVPVTPVFTYADSRPSSDVEHLRGNIDLAATYRRVGVMQHWSYVPARVLWLRRTQPDIYAQIDKWIDFPTYLYRRWFGNDNLRTSHSLAAWSGMQNRSTLDWDAELIEVIDLSQDRLPAISGYADVQHGLASVYASRWNPLRDAKFALGVGDGAAVNIGTGCVTSDRIAITVGTTAAMRLFAEHERATDLPEIPTGLWGYPLDPERTLIGGAFTEGGNVVKWSSEVLRLPDLASLSDALSTRAPGAHGLSALPFLYGERAIGWATDATAGLTGLTGATDALDIVQAMMEAVAYRFALVAELLEPYATDDRIYVAGGNAMTSSDWWVQTIADVLGSDVYTTADEEATTRGAAVLALRAADVWSSLSDHMPELSTKFQPRQKHCETHLEGIARQRALYEKLVQA